MAPTLAETSTQVIDSHASPARLMLKDKFIVSVPLLIGVILLAVSLGLPSGTEDQKWWRGVLASGGAVFIGVSVSELFLKHLPKLIKEKNEREFEQFFGMKYSDVEGQIILQADRIDHSFADLSLAPDDITHLAAQRLSSIR